MYRRRRKNQIRNKQAAAVVHNSKGRRAAAPIGDNRGTTATGPFTVLQRMAVMAAKNWQDQKDPLVWCNLQYAEQSAGGPIGDLQDNTVWDAQTKGEIKEIRMVEHGQERGLGTKAVGKPYTAKDIAKSMFAPATGVPKSVKIGKVTFQSCYAGAGKSSLVSEMAAELADHGREGIPVEGRTGIAFGFEGMGEETAETSEGSNYKWRNKDAKKTFDSKKNLKDSELGLRAYLDAMYTLRNETTRTTGVNIFAKPGDPDNPWDYNKPWTLARKNETEWNLLSASDRGKLVAFQLAKYWEKLVILMGSYGGFKPPEDAIKRLISKK